MDNSQSITTAQSNAAALQTAQVFNSMQALETFGNYIFQSNMFGARNPAEGYIREGHRGYSLALLLVPGSH